MGSLTMVGGKRQQGMCQHTVARSTNREKEQAPPQYTKKENRIRDTLSRKRKNEKPKILFSERLDRSDPLCH